MEPKARLLFVDDEERVVNLLRMTFRGEYEVSCATSGSQALEILGHTAVDVVVSDQRMPGMTGIELLSRVRELSPATMRILLTGYSDLASIVGCVNDGEVFRFVNKPWDHGEIKAIVGEAADIAKATRAAMAQAVPPPGPAEEATPELLLLDESPDDRQAMMKVVGDQYRVHGASTIAEALRVLESRDVGVIVAEARVGGADTRELLRILKRHYPAVATVMMTPLNDAEAVIKLINEAQIYRVAPKPVRGMLFQTMVASAMKQHLLLRSRPELARRHTLAPSAQPENPTLAASVLKSLSGLRERMARLMLART